MKILIIGDVVARPGRRVLIDHLDELRDDTGADFTIVNIENAAGGFGITEKIFHEFLALGIDVMTSGNHVWDKREALEFIQHQPNLLRPHNYPLGTPGSGWVVVESCGVKVGVLNVMGQAFMHPVLDSPFESVEGVLKELGKEVDVIVVDFHAETTSEKVAMGWHLDGRVAAVVGTHTHIPTADERVLPQGTAYITDLGMTGCYDSVIGSDTTSVVNRMVHKIQSRLEPATGPGSLCGVVVDVDTTSGRATSIERVRVEQR
ncbi:MAG: TIGR00282 family metallophosphoesterase [Acidiferrobacterales bacterium]|nr:TIGR00282 family metallophosphoesterase [Acidiferrobacterales bacterium]